MLVKAGRKRKAGFTLIELLVVIAVIGILAAMIFPVFARAREAARKAACISNLKQLGLALVMYQDEWGAYPLHSHKELGNPGWRWMRMLVPYTVVKELHQCPTEGKQVTLTSSAQVYGYNYQYLGNGRNNGYGQPRLLVTDIAAPSETIAIADSWGLRKYVGTSQEQDSGYSIDPPTPSPLFGVYYGGTSAAGDRALVKPRHNGGAVFVFCDGHVKWYRPELLEKDNSRWNGRGTPEP